MKSMPCTLIMNTKNGYTLSPVQCNSIRQAVKTAKENGLAYRIFVNGEQIKQGWIM